MAEGGFAGGMAQGLAGGLPLLQRSVDQDRLAKIEERKQLVDFLKTGGETLGSLDEKQRPIFAKSLLRMAERKLGIQSNPLVQELFLKDPAGFWENISQSFVDNKDVDLKTLRGIFGNEDIFMSIAAPMMKAAQGQQWRDIATGRAGTREVDAAVGEDRLPKVIGSPTNVDTAVSTPLVPDGDQRPAAAAAPPPVVKGSMKRQDNLRGRLEDLQKRQALLVEAGGAGAKEMGYLDNQVKRLEGEIDNLTSNDLRAMIAAQGGDPTNAGHIARAQEALVSYKARESGAIKGAQLDAEMAAEYDKPLPYNFLQDQGLPVGTTLRQLMRQQGTPVPGAAGGAPAAAAAGAAPAAGEQPAAVTVPPGKFRIRSTGEIAADRAGKEGMSKFDVKRFEGIVEAGDNAVKEMPTIQLLQRLLPQIKTGRIVGPTQQLFYQTAQLFGYDADKLGHIETFTSITSDLISKLVKRLPGQLSEKELTFLEKIPANISKSNMANEAVLNMMSKLNDRAIYSSNRAQQWADKFGSLNARAPGGQNFYETMQEYARSNPVLANEMRNPFFRGENRGEGTAMGGSVTGKIQPPR